MLYLKIFKIQRKLIFVRYGFISFLIMYVFYPKNVSVSELVFFHPLLNFLYIYGVRLSILTFIIFTIFVSAYSINTYIGFSELYSIFVRFFQVLIDVWVNVESQSN